MLELPQMKTCSKCKLQLPVSKFALDKQKRDGHYSSCRDCVRIQQGHKKQYLKSSIGTYMGFPVVGAERYPIARGVPNRSNIRVHILVAENKLGRRLLPGEHVHHINGDKMDWSEDNIVVLSQATHRSLEAKLNWSSRSYFLDRYNRGINVRCVTCGKARRLCGAYLNQKWKGDKERAIANYRCQQHKLLFVKKAQGVKLGMGRVAFG